LADRFGIRTLQELKARAAELGGTEYIIEGLFPKQSLSLIVGDSGLGKSALLYQAALSVAFGGPFLDKKVRQGRVLVMDGENGIGQVAVMVGRLSAHLGLVLLCYKRTI
jgi:RecA-family ATPase